MLEAFVAMAICQDAFLAILMFLKRPVSTGHVFTDLGIETILASNYDPWPVVDVWQVVEQFVVHTQSTSTYRGRL